MADNGERPKVLRFVVHGVVLLPLEDDLQLKPWCGKGVILCRAPCSFFCNLSVFRNLDHLTGEARLCFTLEQQRCASPGGA